MLQVAQAFDRASIIGIPTDDAATLAAAAHVFRHRYGWLKPISASTCSGADARGLIQSRWRGPRQRSNRLLGEHTSPG